MVALVCTCTFHSLLGHCLGVSNVPNEYVGMMYLAPSRVILVSHFLTFWHFCGMLNMLSAALHMLLVCVGLHKYC